MALSHSDIEIQIRAFMVTYHGALNAFDPAAIVDFWQFPCRVTTPNGVISITTAAQLSHKMAAMTRIFASHHIAQIDRRIDVIHISDADEALVITRAETSTIKGTAGPSWSTPYMLKRQPEGWRIAGVSNQNFAVAWGQDACAQDQAAALSSLN